MTKLHEVDSKAYDWMIRVNPVQWSRHGFSPRTKSNRFLNNISECFNLWVIQAKDKHILTMMEMIRRVLMVRIHECRDNMLKYKWPICEKIQCKVEKRKLKSRVWTPTRSGGAKFEVRHGGDGYVVNLENRTCTCLKWDLTEIPCPHGVTAIFFQNERVEDYVYAYFKKETFLRTYKALINPMNGPDLWPKTGCDLLLPPKLKRPTGRPFKHRVRDPNEPKNPYKLQRRQSTLKCSNCGCYGHNQRTCKGPVKGKTSGLSGKSNSSVSIPLNASK
ncbi:hypothetical protein ACSBR1_013363 [Camellia fascicularis]